MAITDREIDDPRLPQKQKFTVGVFPFSDEKPHRFNAYTTWYSREWKSCCEHTIFALNGTEAKRLAIAEHKENCVDN